MRIDLTLLLQDGSVEGANGRLEHRLESIRKVAELFKQVKPKVMIETGCQSNDLLHAHGLSTSVFAEFCDMYDGHIHTVDIDANHILLCQQLTTEYAHRITYHNKCSLEFLAREVHKPIDFLYLDSYDFYEGIEEASRQHQLEEIKLALTKMAKPSVILLDDADVQMWFTDKLSDMDREGKTYYSHRYLLENGAQCLVDAYQRVYLWE